MNKKFNMRRKDLIELFRNEEDTIIWCQEKGLLNCDVFCENCGDKLIYYNEDNIFRYQKRKCNKNLSLFSGTIFEKSKIGLSKIMLLIYEWSIDSTICSTAFEYNISKNYVSNWFLKFRILASIFHLIEKAQSIGVPGKIVEVDECLLVKNKYHRGRILSGQRWIFGDIVTNTTDCFIEFVNNRSRKTLIEVIKRRIMPGSIIISDC